MKLALTNNVVYQYAIGEPSATGGAERAQWLLSRALTKTGWSVEDDSSPETGSPHVVWHPDSMGGLPSSHEEAEAWLRGLTKDLDVTG